MNGLCEILIKKRSSQLCAHLKKQDCHLYWYCDRVGIISEFSLILRDVRGRFLVRPVRFAPSQANRNENKCWNNQLIKITRIRKNCLLIPL